MVNLFLSFNLDNSKQFFFILHNTKKHADGSLFVANQMRLREKKSNNTGANTKKAFTLGLNFTFSYFSSSLSYVVVHKEK